MNYHLGTDGEVPNIQMVISANQITRIQNTTPLVTYYIDSIVLKLVFCTVTVIGRVELFKRINKSNCRNLHHHQPPNF
jgi:hypothetical protein